MLLWIQCSGLLLCCCGRWCIWLKHIQYIFTHIKDQSGSFQNFTSALWEEGRPLLLVLKTCWLKSTNTVHRESRWRMPLLARLGRFIIDSLGALIFKVKTGQASSTFPLNNMFIWYDVAFFYWCTFEMIQQDHNIWALMCGTSFNVIWWKRAGGRHLKGNFGEFGCHQTFLSFLYTSIMLLVQCILVLWKRTVPTILGTAAFNIDSPYTSCHSIH